ncbi:hypothetical protein SCP_0901860 [Sparassis crispa]|uniref:Uncharacterized protein n=1 Tax=Sparassis crispa TaxID=139825 RepID=A0A401GVQ0_9APHY|nr:hypothetical protein SCP_0901860 [Sparassis crispa]GBE86307.1 hypothetical protein SCP_0901860 [Sparassis crispa]
MATPISPTAPVGGAGLPRQVGVAALPSDDFGVRFRDSNVGMLNYVDGRFNDMSAQIVTLDGQLRSAIDQSEVRMRNALRDAIKESELRIVTALSTQIEQLRQEMRRSSSAGSAHSSLVFTQSSPRESPVAHPSTSLPSPASRSTSVPNVALTNVESLTPDNVGQRIMDEGERIKGYGNFVRTLTGRFKSSASLRSQARRGT